MHIETNFMLALKTCFDFMLWFVSFRGLRKGRNECLRIRAIYLRLRRLMMLARVAPRSNFIDRRSAKLIFVCPARPRPLASYLHWAGAAIGGVVGYDAVSAVFACVSGRSHRWDTAKTFCATASEWCGDAPPRFVGVGRPVRR